MDVWDVWGLGGTPEFFAGGGDPMSLPLLSIGSAASLPGINRSSMGPWDAIASIGSAVASNLFAPASPQIIPQDPLESLGRVIFGQAEAQIPQVLARSLPARCATTAGMSGLNCVMRNGKLIQKSTRRRIKLVPDGQGSFTPIICCAKPRMNVLNPRALSRAARRLAGFQKFAGRVDKLITRQLRSKARPRHHAPSWAERSQRCLPARCR